MQIWSSRSQAFLKIQKISSAQPAKQQLEQQDSVHFGLGIRRRKHESDESFQVRKDAINARRRAQRKDLAKKKALNAQQLRQEDPAKKKAVNAQRRQYYYKQMENPEYRIAKNKRQREQYRKRIAEDPGYRVARNAQERDRVKRTKLLKQALSSEQSYTDTSSAVGVASQTTTQSEENFSDGEKAVQLFLNLD